MKNLNVLPVASLFKYVLTLKFYFSNSFKLFVSHKHELRNLYLIEPRFQNDYGRQLWEHTVPALLNELPKNLLISPNYREIKIEIKKWHLTKT